MWLAQHNVYLSRIFQCNNNIQYVVNPRVAWYMACYSTKQTNEVGTATSDCTTAALRKLHALEALEEANTTETVSAFSKGLRLLHAGWHGFTKSAVIGAQRACLFLLGRGSHLVSHEFKSAGIGRLERYLAGKVRLHNFWYVMIIYFLSC